MNMKDAIYVAMEIMRDAGIKSFYRGIPTHCIENDFSPGAGKYSPRFHVVITGKEYTDNTLVHEACHALQKPNRKDPDYMNNYYSYMNDPQEKEAFFVASMFEYGIKVEKGDLELWNMGNPKGSLLERINEMINRKYRR